MEWRNTYEVLTKFGQQLVGEYRNKLQSHRASGTLQDTMTYVINAGTDSIELSLRLQDYWKYLEDGTKPHWPPMEAIEKWIEIKPVLPYPGRDGKLPTPQQLAFLIARKISEVGTQGDGLLQESITDVMTEFEFQLDEAVTRDVDANLALILAYIK